MYIYRDISRELRREVKSRQIHIFKEREGDS